MTPNLRTACYCTCFSAQEECEDLRRPAWTAPDDQRIQTGKASPMNDLCHCHICVSPRGERRHAIPSRLSPTELPLRRAHCIREGHTTHSCTSTRAAPKLWQLSMDKELCWAPEPEADVRPSSWGPSLV